MRWPVQSGERKQAGVEMNDQSSIVLLPGTARGPVLKLTADISFWGGVDPLSGKIIDRRHPQFDECLKGKILAMRRSIGSSSGSSVLLELFRRGCGPLGIILTEADLVVTLGVVVAREMSFASVPVLCLDESAITELPEKLAIGLQGKIKPVF